MAISTVTAICALFFIVALLYSTVGHGGASGYMAVMSFFTFTPSEMSSTALMLNLLVAGTSFILYYKGGHMRWRLAMPFIIASVPMAFIGGTFPLSIKVFSLLLASTLLFASFRLMVDVKPKGVILEGAKFPPLATAVAVGAAIGLLSGMVGVGGGIFLSPIILLAGWADPKQTAAVSALFILVNSVAGLGGRFASSSLTYSNLSLIPFVVSAFIGGLLGSYFGTKRFSGLMIRRLLGIVLIIAAIKLIIVAVK